MISIRGAILDMSIFSSYRFKLIIRLSFEALKGGYISNIWRQIVAESGFHSGSGLRQVSSSSRVGFEAVKI